MSHLDLEMKYFHYGILKCNAFVSVYFVQLEDSSIHCTYQAHVAITFINRFWSATHFFSLSLVSLYMI